MQAEQPRRRSIWKILLIVSVVVVVGAGAGFVYLKAAGNSSQASDQTADAGDAAKQGEEGEKAGEESGEKKQGEKDQKGEKGKDEKEPIPVSVSELELGSLSSYVSATANLVAEDEVKVLAEAEGRVEVLKVEEGDFVAKGELLASLVKDDQEIAYEKAKVREANARAIYERNSRMGSQNMISEEELEKAATDFKVSQQELAEARWNLDKTRIRAPFSGRVTMRNVTLGQHVRLGDELFTVTDFEPLVARIFLPEKDIVGLEQGRDVRITLKADSNVQFAGKIRQISPVVDTATGTVKITIEAIKPPRQVRPGGFVNVDIIRETRENIVVVPREAVIRELQTAHVFIVNGEKAEKRDVTIGLEEGDLVEAKTGINAGEQVIVAGQGALKDGEDVKIIPQATAQESSNKDKRPERPARS